MIRIELDITRECNFRCRCCDRMCNLIPNNKESVMTVEEVEAILESLSKHEIEQLTIIGGEPTLNPNFEKICEIVSKSDFIERKLLATNHSNENLVLNISRMFPNIIVRYDNGNNIEDIGKIKNGIHYNTLLSPKEEDMETVVPCHFMHTCGINIHKYDGSIKYFWCSGGTTIAKLLGKEHLLKDSIDELLSDEKNFKANEMKEICINCMYSAIKPIKASEDGRVSECFKKNLEKIVKRHDRLEQTF